MNRIRQIVYALSIACCALPVAAQQFVYPAKGQTPQQQQKDEGECYTWAVQQSGFDPAKPPAQAAAPSAPAPQAPKPTGGRVRGAAAGAAVGAIADKDVGDAAVAGAVGGAAAQRGARRQQQKQQQASAQQQQQAAAQQQQAGQGSFQKARAACLEGRGYTIK